MKIHNLKKLKGQRNKKIIDNSNIIQEEQMKMEEKEEEVKEIIDNYEKNNDKSKTDLNIEKGLDSSKIPLNLSHIEMQNLKLNKKKNK